MLLQFHRLFLAVVLCSTLLGVWHAHRQLSSSSSLRLEASAQSSYHRRRAPPPLSENKREKKSLPSWRVLTECSAYDLGCVTTGGKVFDSYPLAFPKNETRLTSVNSAQGRRMASRILSDPPFSTEKEVWWRRATARKSIGREGDLGAQLTRVLAAMPKKGVVSWTMSDAAYAENFHDAESMALTVAGFENFFLVALDLETTRACVAKGMACVSTSTEQSSSLKTSVQMSKFSVSFWLARHGVDFVFFEMDVWFLKSMNDLFRESTTDVVVAAHQNNPTSANIGVYGVRGNNRTAEFFRTCIEESERDPDKHDQKIFHNVMTYHRLEYRGIQRDPTPWRDKPKSPRPASPISSAFIPPHVGVCSTHPVPTEASVFIHTLGTGPLKGQHGKKIHAKELGAWHGLGRTSANGTSYYGPLAHDGRTRYVALDGRPLMALSIDERDGYHNARWIKAHIAVLVAIARATQRVAILPKIIADYHVHFAWPFLDLQSLQGICDFRETNFAANRKSWKNATHAFTDVVQVSLRDTSVGLLSEDSRTTWQSFDPKQSWDAWAQTIHRPEELLLVHDAFVGHDFVRVLTNCESAAHCERDGVPRHFHSILSRLRWCGSDINLNRHVSVVFQGMDCYGTGITHQEQRKQLLEAKKKQKNNRKGL